MKLMVDLISRCLRRKVICCSRVLSLNDKSSATLMAYMSNAAVMGIVALNIYNASYFLAWKKDDSLCHVFPDSASSAKTNSLIQLIVVSLLFASLPLAFCIGSLAQAAKAEKRYLGCASCLVLIEIIYVIVLGAVMTACMSDVSGASVATVAVAILGLLILLWGCCCHRPKRYLVLCKCWCLDLDAEHAALVTKDEDENEDEDEEKALEHTARVMMMMRRRKF